MFEKILDCPVCEKRFHYEHEGTVFPELLTCPFCGNEGFYGDYSALLLCTNCRKKLKVPLDILYDEGLSCPQCGAAIQTEEPNEFGTEDGTTIAGVAGTASRRRMLQDGEFFDKFRIISFLGSGGMAEVYLAEHLLLKQQCALKLMRSGMDQDDPVFIKRFVREAKVTHQLNHPNIVRVFDAGSDFQTGCLFIAMEYVEGCTLHDMFQKELFSEDDMLAVLDSMASALEKLEEAKVVHRDIKPSNIMYTADGVYKLMDLGIAKSENNRQAGEVTLTVEQSTIGTPGYASPEQCSAAHSVDIRSDIYSLGVTIYHIASGVMPFDAETPVAVIVKMMQTEAEPLKNHRPDLSAGFLELVERMMKKDPAARPQNAAELRELIFRVVSGKKISSNKRHEVIKHKLSNVEWRKVLKKTGYILLLLLIAAVAAVHLIYVA
ncbi:MAG: serine/threonine protein kinase, partial [Lentisphaeria bacterium]|nr:serine/threonine protein kinase [Lentisphaeria bacterium]